MSRRSRTLSLRPQAELQDTTAQKTPNGTRTFVSLTCLDEPPEYSPRTVGVTAGLQSSIRECRDICIQPDQGCCLRIGLCAALFPLLKPGLFISSPRLQLKAKCPAQLNRNQIALGNDADVRISHN